MHVHAACTNVVRNQTGRAPYRRGRRRMRFAAHRIVVIVVLGADITLPALPRLRVPLPLAPLKKKCCMVGFEMCGWVIMRSHA